jgi:peptide/nickel transport system substrate-binding protein
VVPVGVTVPAAAQSAKFREAPILGEQVKAGKLSPVEQRLPVEPLVVPVVERTGQYGGVWRRAFLGPADFNNYVRVVYDALARFSPDGAVPGSNARRGDHGRGRREAA